MGLIIIGLILLGGCIFLFKMSFKIDGFIGSLPAILGSTILFIAAGVSILIGFIGVGKTEENIELLNTSELTGVGYSDSKYVFFDQDGVCYYFNESRVTIIEDKYSSSNYACIVIKGECDKPFVEEYTIDYQMNFWTFALVDGKVYKLYIPENMTG